MTLQREKTRIEEQNTKLNKQLGDSQLTIAGLEKKVEKLQLNLEDLNHEIAREVTSNRNAEKIAHDIEAEGDGAENAVKAFHRHLPLFGENTMRCCIFQDRVAVWVVKDTRLTLSSLLSSLEVLM